MPPTERSCLERSGAELFLGLQTFQCIRGSKDGDALVLAQIEKIVVARDDKVRGGSRCTGKDVIGSTTSTKRS
jgi:hypothetical protein